MEKRNQKISLSHTHTDTHTHTRKHACERILTYSHTIEHTSALYRQQKEKKMNGNTMKTHVSFVFFFGNSEHDNVQYYKNIAPTHPPQNQWYEWQQREDTLRTQKTTFNANRNKTWGFNLCWKPSTGFKVSDRFPVFQN